MDYNVHLQVVFVVPCCNFSVNYQQPESQLIRHYSNDCWRELVLEPMISMSDKQQIASCSWQDKTRQDGSPFIYSGNRSTSVGDSVQIKLRDIVKLRKKQVKDNLVIEMNTDYRRRWKRKELSLWNKVCSFHDWWWWAGYYINWYSVFWCTFRWYRQCVQMVLTESHKSTESINDNQQNGECFKCFTGKQRKGCKCCSWTNLEIL